MTHTYMIYLRYSFGDYGMIGQCVMHLFFMLNMDGVQKTHPTIKRHTSMIVLLVRDFWEILKRSFLSFALIFTTWDYTRPNNVSKYV